jgi:DNA-binding transcriptional MerR regulator
VATSTLRTWNRRYGIGPAEHEAGRHRRYNASDVARLEAMCALVVGGLAPASAAQLVRGGGGYTSDGLLEEERGPSQADARAAVRGLLSAVLRLDADIVQRTVERRIATVGVVDTWVALCVPTLAELGRRTETGFCIEAEHLFSWALTAALHRVTGPVRRTHSRGVLLSCAPGERHTLALDALRAVLAERGVLVRVLGADLPTAALCDATSRTRPVAVALWAQTERTARVGVLAQVQTRGSAAVIALGPGWARRRMPRGVLTADTLPTAVLTILTARPCAVVGTRPPASR